MIRFGLLLALLGLGLYGTPLSFRPAPVFSQGIAPALGDGPGNIRISEAERAEFKRHIGTLDIPAESGEALIRFLDEAAEGDYIPPGFALTGDYEALCAKAVSRLFWSFFGGEDDPEKARGVSGDAWDMAGNILIFGGEVFPWTGEGGLRTGDIIGLFFQRSAYNYAAGSRGYTHLALVIDNIPGRGALIAHWWKAPPEYPAGKGDPWFFRVEYLEALLDDFPGLFAPQEVLRPRNVFVE
jgi:hypothetical protein